MVAFDALVRSEPLETTLERSPDVGLWMRWRADLGECGSSSGCCRVRSGNAPCNGRCSPDLERARQVAEAQGIAVDLGAVLQRAQQVSQGQEVDQGAQGCRGSSLEQVQQQCAGARWGMLPLLWMRAWWRTARARTPASRSVRKHGVSGKCGQGRRCEDRSSNNSRGRMRMHGSRHVTAPAGRRRDAPAPGLRASQQRGQANDSLDAIGAHAHG
jgi:hypothetical protein